MAGGGRPPAMPAEPASPQARPRPYPTPPAGAVKSHPGGGGSHLHPAGRSTMPACRVGLLVAALLLGLLLLGLPPVTSTGVEKTGVCPELKDDLNCTQECGSDGECADNLKCCRAGCATVCHLPNEKQGSCPQVDLPLTPLGLCRDQCQVDSQCSGQMKCCRNGCGKVSCVTPIF